MNKKITTKEVDKHSDLIRMAEKEIYENITQCLCLARIQLGSIEWQKTEQVVAMIGEANLLIGKAVKDLRNLANHLSGK
jgi:hypothetical protein